MNRKKYIGLALFGVILLMTVFMGHYERTNIKDGVAEVEARVVEIIREDLHTNGLSTIGFQEVRVRILTGQSKGQTVNAMNQLNGQVDYDQLYRAGDKLIVGLQYKDGLIYQGRTVELYRQEWLGWMFLLFVIALLVYAKIIGVKALISFVLSLFIIWEVLIKGLLRGMEPLLLVTITVVLLSTVIIFLVTGFTRRGSAAFLGTLTGLFVTMILTLFFGQKMGLYGLTQPYVQTLFVSGFFDLDYREIFYAAIILGASGAAMDIAVDISAAIHEIKEQTPDISTHQLIRSGFNVGRQVIGTMATTLLLAYSGSYLTLLMLFLAKDASLIRILNLKIVAGELMRTVIGSIGLVVVAPATAFLSAMFENDPLFKTKDNRNSVLPAEYPQTTSALGK